MFLLSCGLARNSKLVARWPDILTPFPLLTSHVIVIILAQSVLKSGEIY